MADTMAGGCEQVYRSSVFLTAFRHGIDVRNFDPYLYRDSVPEEDIFGPDLGSTIKDIHILLTLSVSVGHSDYAFDCAYRARIG